MNRTTHQPAPDLFGASYFKEDRMLSTVEAAALTFVLVLVINLFFVWLGRKK